LTGDSGSGSSRILIRGGAILSMDPEVGDLPTGDLLVDGPRILDVQRVIDVSDAEVIDAEHCIVIPGLVDSHRHTWQSSFKLVGADWLSADYFRMVRQSIGPNVRAEDVYIANLLGALEALHSGITSLFDWSHIMSTPEHADAAIAGLVDSGIRAVFGYGNSNAGFTLPNEIRIDEADARRVRDSYFADNTGRVTMAMALRGPDFSSLQVTQDDFAASRRLGLPISVHVGSNGRRAGSVLALERESLLGEDVAYVHCNTSTAAELDLIRETGGRVSISPETECHHGTGIPPLGKLLKHGLRPSLSSDVPSSVGVDMFGQMRSVLAIHRGLAGQGVIDDADFVRPPELTTRDLLGFATVEGARVNRVEDRVGTLTPGKQADITIISTSRGMLRPVNNPYATVVLAAGPGDVDTVLVAGEILKRGGRLRADVDHIASLAESSCAYLLERAGISPGDFLSRPT
jgi:5-methylthioadenosine/S-adenosylhomocysteine deaminase